MNKTETLVALENYHPADPAAAAFRQRTIEFVQNNEGFWQRSTLAGHLTGSAWILSADKQRVLLIHHAKLDRWLQPGGHADDTDASLLHTALREASEECSASGLVLLQDGIFDIDIHPIPARGQEPEHLHYDIRFLFQLPDEGNLQADAAEIKGMQWVDINTLQGEDTPESLRRMANAVEI